MPLGKRQLTMPLLSARRQLAWVTVAANLTFLIPELALAQDIQAAPTSNTTDTPSVDQCITASEAALESMSQDLILEARKHAKVCAHPGCPDVIREECLRLGEQWASSQPRLTFRVVGPTGEDVPAARVVLNGSAIGQPGDPVEVNPGEHVAHFEAAGYVSQKQTLVVNKGDGTRLWRATLEATPVEKPAQAAADSASPRVAENSAVRDSSLGATKEAFSTMEVTGIAVAGVGVLGLATSGVFMLLAKRDYDDSVDEGCNSRGECPTQKGVDFADAARDKANIATPFVIGGGALVLGGAALYFLGDTLFARGEARSAHVNVQPVLSRGVAGFSVDGQF